MRVSVGWHRAAWLTAIALSALVAGCASNTAPPAAGPQHAAGWQWCDRSQQGRSTVICLQQ